MHIMQSPPGAETVIDGKRYLYFAGTGYLGLQGHPEVINACCEAAKLYGIGSATTRTGFGNNPPLLDVEKRAADFFGAEDSFYYVSGYCGNAIMVQGLKDQFDVIFFDELAHYSVVDGILQGEKRYYTFRHLDQDDLSRQMKKNVRPGERPLLITDGIFAVSGIIPPVHKYLSILDNYTDPILCLDDAHAIAVLGDNGRGTYEYLELEVRNMFFSGTLSKAVGGHGGIIAGSKSFVNRLREMSHLFDGASPPPAPAAAATAKGLEIVMEQPELRQKLWANVGKLKSGLSKLGFETDNTPVPIICLEQSDSLDLSKIQKELMNKGIIVAFVKSYAGVHDVIRIAASATHSDEMLERLLEELGRLV